MTLMQRYPAVRYLREKAKRRIPHVAWEFLDSGTGGDVAAAHNVAAFDQLTLVPRYMKGAIKPVIDTELFGVAYAAPFGIAPIGQSGFIWPGAEAILARTAAARRIPYALSTVAAQSIETIAPLTGGMGWFQLYPPKDLTVMEDLVARAAAAGFTAMMVTADVPVPSRRERQFRAGLTLPPRLSPQVAAQIALRPGWCLAALRHGRPRFGTLEPYVAKLGGDGGAMKEVSDFMRRTMGGALDWEYLARVRALWPGPLVLKGILDRGDAIRAVDAGVDGILVSNHGGRQLDCAPTPLAMLPEIRQAVGARAKVMLDSGLRSGGDVLKAIALGADFVFLGRAFQYGVAALGARGGDHVVDILTDELTNVMAQVGIATFDELSENMLRRH